MSDPVELLASKWPRRVTVTSSTKGVVVGVQSSPSAVWVVVAGIPGQKSMKFTAGFQRSWADLGDQIVGKSVMVSFVDGQPIVVDVIVGGV